MWQISGYKLDLWVKIFVKNLVYIINCINFATENESGIARDRSFLRVILFIL